MNENSSTSTAYDADVIIVGGGPVGLSGAIDLDSRGISTIVVETRPFGSAPEVKCNHIASRTMERFRQLGLADDIRDAGLPADYPHDVAFRTTVVGQEIGRITIPSREGRRGNPDHGHAAGNPAGADTDWATPEPPHRINQTFFEPVLQQHAAWRAGITLLNETEFHGYRHDDDGVSVEVSELGSDKRRTLRARYLIGADGARSRVRKQLGATLSGDPVLQQVQSTLIRAPHLYAEMAAVNPEPRAWGYYVFNRRRRGHVYAIDGHELFLVHTYLTEAEFEEDSVDRNEAIRGILGVDDSFALEIVSRQDWVARRLLADTFGRGRVFIAGDACHLWVPFAGYGMNAGIADVLNLTWLLAAELEGWGGPGILDAYQAERRPITEEVSRLAMGHQQKLAASSIPDYLEEDSPRGRAARDDLGRAVVALNTTQFAAEGLNFGYAYSNSPIIVHDGENAPGYSMGEYRPSTVPGCRAPHFWLSDGCSLYDRLTEGYTLLTVGNVDDGVLLRLAAERGIPLARVDLSDEPVPDLYDRRAYLVRTDQHIVWRGDELPGDVDALLDILSGHTSPAVTSTAQA